jgi:hypothetical protein
MFYQRGIRVVEGQESSVNCDLPDVMDELAAVLHDLVGRDVDLDGDPVQLMVAIDRAADDAKLGRRDPAAVSQLLVRLDVVLAR